MESQLFEKIGRLQTELDRVTAEKSAILQVFAEVLSGKCDPKRVMINLTAGEVTWAPEGCRASLPPTINGLPVCVVAPEEAARGQAG